MICLMRLCPLVPYVLFNYMVGLTKITLFDFVLGGVGMLPGVLLRVFIGSTLSALTQENFSIPSLFEGNKKYLIITMGVAGMLIGIAGIAYITIVTKRYVRELEERQSPMSIDPT